MSHCLYRGQARFSFEIRIWKDMQRWFQREIVRCGFSQDQFCLSQSQRGRLCSQELQEEGTVWIRSREGPPLKPDRLSWEVGIWHLVTKFRYFITVKGVLLTSELNLCQILSKSLGFPRQEYRSRYPFPSPGDLPNPGIKPRSLWP